MRFIPTSRRTVLVAALCTAVLVSTGTPAIADVHYVRAAASGTNDGSSWTNAFMDLQLALAAAQNGDEIWVAGGTYKPAPPDGLRRASFDLKTGVALYGGFAGFETLVAQRDFVANPTILSGDLNGDDSRAYFDWVDHGENVWHVVRGNNVGATAVLDGFVVSGGYADTPLPADHQDGRGGGVVALDASPTCRNLTVVDNFALRGGGVSRATLKDSIVMYNQAGYGGGVHADVISLNACRIFGNRSTSNGNAIYLAFGGESLIVNCLVYGNSGAGTAILGEYVSAKLVNCTVVYNQATFSFCAGVADFGEASGITVRNSILWGNRGDSGPLLTQQIAGSSSQTGVVEGLTAPDGSGNIGLDPRFRDPLGPDRVIGTSDDDYRLVLASACIDSGNNALVPSGVTTDVAGLARFFDAPLVPDHGVGLAPIVDRGAHESDGTTMPFLRPTKKP